MTARVELSLKSLSVYLEDLAQAGQDVDQVVAEALMVGGDVILERMQELVPERTGNLKRNIVRTEVFQDGNFSYLFVGMDVNADADTARYGYAVEYGYKRGRKQYPPQSYIRAGFDQTKSAALKAMRDTLKARGALP
jgi:HK97 gp10 family phage protein